MAHQSLECATVRRKPRIVLGKRDVAGPCELKQPLLAPFKNSLRNWQNEWKAQKALQAFPAPVNA